ncbi:universal stress protein [Galbibacter sp.]|jgi:nucleotide-binding universal stress UspA family protein|uniref:universal stress protein n=1 Tax=Galbibacter sp. TaxID=2918471 RepID=UPI003A8EE0AB
MENILVAIGQTKDAEKLIPQAVKFAKYSNGKIWIIHVAIPDPDSLIGREAGPQFIYDQRAENRKKEAAFIQECAQIIRDEYGIEAEAILVQGAVSTVLREKVDKLNIDLVIAGHRKKDFIYNLFTANNKKDLVDELKVPLLAVPLR